MRLCLAALIVLQLLASTMVMADDIDSLLRQTEQALGHGQKKSDESPDDDSQSPAKHSPKRKSRPRPTTTTPAPSQAPSSEAKPDAGVLTPTDADSVQELIKVNLKTEAQLQADRRDHDLTLSLAYARTRGGYKLEKDDDTFHIHRGERALGLDLDYIIGLAQHKDAWEIGSYRVHPLIRVSASYLRGQMSVQRRGVQNQDISPDNTLLPISVAFGARMDLSDAWRLAFSYGPAMTLLIQTGSGDSDSTSGTFFADTLQISVDRHLTEAMRLQLAWTSLGLVTAKGDAAAHDMLSLGLQFLLVR